MKRILKWSGLGFAGLAALIICFYGIMYMMSEREMNVVYDIRNESLVIPTDAASIATGKRLTITRSCTDCHGNNLAGKVVVDNAALGFVAATNLTRGQGGVGSRYTDADWVRAIRHGVRSDGKPLIIMPSQELYYLSDDDLACLIAYVKQLPAVDNILPEKRIGPLARVLFGIGKLPELLPAAMINHDAARPDAPPVGITPEYGRYLSVGCQGCHRQDLAGGEPLAPGYPVVPSLTSTGHLVKWSESDFITTIRNGTTPEGVHLRSKFMPWPSFAQMTDDELKAIWTYLLTLRSTSNPVTTISSAGKSSE